MKKIILFLCASFLIVGGAFAQSSYQKKLSKMMEAQGAEETFKTTITAIMGQMKTMNSEVPAEAWDELEKEFMKASIDELIEMLVPVYEKHLTESDLDQIIKFYESPIGKKLARATPALTQESMMVGQQWGMKIGQIVTEKLEEKGY